MGGQFEGMERGLCGQPKRWVPLALCMEAQLPLSAPPVGPQGC